MKSETLRLNKLLGKTFWLTLLILAVLICIAEGIARSEYVQGPLSPPKMGSRHYQLGHKLTLLDRAIKKNGDIDCLIVGSSMVDLGFDPGAIRKGYREITERDIRCFNFGIDASSATSAAAIAQILVEDYQPRLLILGTDPRDFTLPSNDRDPVAVLETPWIRYRLGDFSLDGWLTEYSYLYRYRQHFSRLLRLNFYDTLLSQTTFPFEILQNGYTPFSEVATYINDPPDSDDDSFEVTYYTQIYSTYEILDENLDALEQIMGLTSPGTQVIIVEMPVADGLYYFFGNGEKDYQRFIDQVSALSEKYQVPFLRTEPLDNIPDDGWFDYSHLNTTGAEIFSTWFGQQIGEAEEKGIIATLEP